MSSNERLSVQQQISQSERLRQRDGVVTHVQVANGLWLPFSQFFEPVVVEQEHHQDNYFPHINGGGLVAVSALAPDTLVVPQLTRVDSDTRVLRDLNFKERHVYLGDVGDNGERYTRFMTKDDEKLLDTQSLEGPIARVLKLEQHLAMRAMRQTKLA